MDLSEIARIWTEGCIIKSDLMKSLVETIKKDSKIIFSEPWSSIIKKSHADVQAVATKCINSQLHIPCFLESLNYFHGLNTADGSANLIQAQRDYFGAHTYKLKDDESQKSYHTEWI